jgi:general secretion pathway protein A
MVYCPPVFRASKSAFRLIPVLVASRDAQSRKRVSTWSAMMPDFATEDVGTPAREWWRRCLPPINQALAVGVLLGLLVGGGLAVSRLPLDTLTLWGKYQMARGAARVGLSSVKITWPGERGESLMTVDDLLKMPGLEAWAQPVSRNLADTVAPSLLSGTLAFLAALLWSATRSASDPSDSDGFEPVPAAMGTPAIAVEEPRPLILPQISSPPEGHPRPIHHAMPAEPDGPPESARHESPAPRPAAWPPAPPRAAPAGKSPSYESHWGLAELPFENVPDPKFYFPAPMHEEALHRLLYGIQTRKGAVMLTGEIGCGKTLLSRELSLHLSGQQYDMAMIANPSFGVEDFLAEVLYQLGIEPTKTKVKLLHLLNDRLHENYQRGKQTVIVVDEAQAIPDDQVFEELRLLLNFQLNDRFLLTLVLMGQPELNDRVMAIKQFAQRISIKYHLGPFSQEQTAQYVDFRMKAARCQREVFTKDALAVVFQRSGGVPRNINRLCDLCLLIGYMDRAPNISEAVVERAAADLS